MSVTSIKLSIYDRDRNLLFRKIYPDLTIDFPPPEVERFFDDDNVNNLGRIVMEMGYD
jgi:hypothetical protein